MKVLILSVSDKRHMPMVSAYEKYLAEKKINYEIIRTSRYDHNEIQEKKTHEYDWIQSVNSSKIKKIIPFVQFRRYAKRIIKKEKYDFIIVWNENTAVLFADLLMRRFNGKYCVNIRDIPDQHVLSKIMWKVCDRSCFTTVPSPYGLPSGKDIKVLYNRDDKLLQLINPKESFRKEIDHQICITFLGFYHRAPNAFHKLVEVFGNDNRYKLVFAGQGFDTDMKTKIGDKYSNVFLYGPFPYEKTAEYLSEADIINSYYDSFDNTSDHNLRGAVGIKESYVPMLYIPGLVDDDTYWADICRKYGFCYVIDEGNIASLADDLYMWYKGLDFASFKAGCDKFNTLIEESRRELYMLCDYHILGLGKGK